MKNRTKLGALLAAGLLTFGITASLVFAATGASDQGVTPTWHDGNITAAGDGNNDAAACDLADTVELAAAGSGESTNGVTVTMTYDSESKAVGFSASGGVVTIAYVKGGSAYNEYNYGAGVASDGNLFAPDNASDGPAGLSHAVFCTGPAGQPNESPSGSGAGDTDQPPTLAPSDPPSDQPSDQPPTVAPTGTPAGTGNGDNDQPTQPPTNGLASNGSGPSDGAWLLVVGLGVLLASIVVLTPTRVKSRR
jgi:hypothetical protein